MEFYVGQYNSHLPHSAFQGHTPDEMYFGTGRAVSDELEAARREAMKSRIEANREIACDVCDAMRKPELAVAS